MIATHIKPGKSRLVAAAVLLAVTVGCRDKQDKERKEGSESVAAMTTVEPQGTKPGLARLAMQIYDGLRASGEKVEDYAQWVKEDLEKSGTWEYKVVTLAPASDEDVEEKLNMLGAERWECFCLADGDDAERMFLKRAKESRLKSAGQLAKYIPHGGGGRE